MAMLFQNTTKLTESGMSNMDMITANNNLGREKKKMRYTVTAAVGIPVFIVIYFFLTPNLFHNYGTMLLIGLVSLVIGYIPAEIAVRSKYGDTTGAVQAAASNSRIIKYSFMDDKILINEGLNTDNIFYNQIVKVTQNPYYYYIYTANQMFQISKTGFSVNAQEFEKLMTNCGLTIGVDFGV